ncbi:MAG: tetraacyldisaccharide 4'-kinase [Burkholderiaceae bacterium]|nr:tetraacyldisaccharide 4'-kinase [Burkholderiaceae bacterium]
MRETLKSRLHQAVLRAWLQRGPVAWLLWPLSLLMGAVVRMRRHAYRAGLLASSHPGVPVIVVGNVVAGGAGKTPTVMAVVRHLQSRGLKTGVISRGWGRHDDAVVPVRADSSPAEVGDEPLLIHHQTGVPVFVGARRIDAARALLRSHPDTDVIVCDDGLQHLALRRDIEICVFDERGIGNGFLLPAGLLREPWPRQVDLVLVTTSGRSGSPPPGVGGGFTARRMLAGMIERADGTRATLAELGRQRFLAVAGIARPQAFFDMLADAGVKPAQIQALPDHYDFSSWISPIDAGMTVICTEKDALKLWGVCPQAWAVGLQLTPEPAFFAALDLRVDAALGRSLSSPHGHQTA